MIIYTSNAAKSMNACVGYRILTPMRQLHELCGVDYFVDTNEGEKEEAIKAAIECDIYHMYNASQLQTKYQLDTILSMKAAQTPEGLRIPATTIYDADDNVDYTHPFNPSFATYGVRGYPDTTLLSPGEQIDWVDAKGERTPLWIDRKSRYENYTYDIEVNLRRMNLRHSFIRRAHGATASSPPLAAYFRDVLGQKNVYVFPNTLVPSEYENFDLVRHDPDTVRILWQGGASHYLDWYRLREPIRTISQKYKNIKWVIFGEKPNWLTGYMPDDMVEYHPWVEYPAYKLKRGLMNIDINLCPLVNEPFNRCKSGIKWYEASIWKKPEATLAADVAPYQEIEEGKTGLLYKTPDEFVEKLSGLIENAELRKKLGAGAREWVLNNRTPEHTIPGLFEFYAETRSRQYYEAGGKGLIELARK